MPQVCIYLHLHQPYRFRQFDVLDVGLNQPYFAGETDDNREIFQKVARKSYIPMLSLLRNLLEWHPGFCFALSITGVFIEQARAYYPEVLQLLKDCIASGRVEILAETYHHSLASLYSPQEFFRQVAQHSALLEEEFDFIPCNFRNTELVYSNHIAKLVRKLGFVGMLTEGVSRNLHGRSLTQVFRSTGSDPLFLLLKHAQLSDDIAFRFSDKNWKSYPLHVDTYLQWIEGYGEAEIVNLFMDFETFGEHQWADTGIFDFFKHFVNKFVRNPWNAFRLPATVLSNQQPGQLMDDLPVYDVPVPISWADVDRDLTAWTDNAYQRDCLRVVYEMEDSILLTKNKKLIEDWRKLQTSDHFYYMCTKWSADGDVHAYFSPYDSPHEAYRRYSIVLADMKNRLLRIAAHRS